MTTKPTKLERPDVHFDAILALVGILLGFLFVVVIYILEFPHEFLTAWGMPLIMFLTITYALGLAIMGSIINHEINFYLAKNMLEIKLEEFPSEKYAELRHNAQRSLRSTLRLLLYFIFSFGLFLINLASFTASKLLASTFFIIETSILISWGPLVVLLLRLLVMFAVQFILIIPFARFQGNLWDSYKTLENLQDTSKDSAE